MMQADMKAKTDELNIPHMGDCPGCVTGDDMEPHYFDRTSPQWLDFCGWWLDNYGPDKRIPRGSPGGFQLSR